MPTAAQAAQAPYALAPLPVHLPQKKACDLYSLRATSLQDRQSLRAELDPLQGRAQNNLRYTPRAPILRRAPYAHLQIRGVGGRQVKGRG